jgi:hypothetical protein
MRGLLAISLVCIGLFAVGQTSVLKLNTSFVLGLRQVGGFALEYVPDSSSISYGLGLEFGNFESRQLGVGTSQMDTRTQVGAAISPHLRYYPLRQNRTAPHGFFIEANFRLRFVRETSVTGVTVSPLGYDLDDAIVQSQNRWIEDLSCGLGFKTGMGKRNLEFEFLGGVGHSPRLGQTFYRLELYITGIFSRKSKLGEDFFW